MTPDPSIFTLSAGELARHSPVKFELLPDLLALFEHFAEAIASEIEGNNALGKPTRIILPVGPVGQYPLLVEKCHARNISWRNVHVFHMDEYCDWQGRWVALDHPLSFRGYCERNLYQPLGALRPPPEQVHFPDPLRLDSIAQAIQAAGGVDTCYGGIGINGHVAFNEPPRLLFGSVSAEQMRQSTTRLVPLSAESLVMNGIRNAGGNLADFPHWGITIGMAEILGARRIRFYCPGGAWQRAILRRALLAQPEALCPVTLLQGHPDYIIYADSQTAQPAEMVL